ncbi:type II toxin-antitoxin system YhaV family toxin (plasmid) [Microvirga sp. RSM25]|uniref:type II toxin-antitoxin system YhaV family toxin n=1 Tax=Microvirga sp. RSM25 TaxID=3273802 RepID=UPI00384DE5A7
MNEPTIVVNGWKIYAHPVFLDQLEAYQTDFHAVRAKHPKDYKTKKATKLYAALLKTAFEVIPADPTNPDFRQGSTLGDDNKNWFRAKFLQQFRLFFRYAEDKKTIVIGWVNNEDTKRAYGSKTDAYETFKKMLKAGILQAVGTNS